MARERIMKRGGCDKKGSVRSCFKGSSCNAIRKFFATRQPPSRNILARREVLNEYLGDEEYLARKRESSSFDPSILLPLSLSFVVALHKVTESIGFRHSAGINRTRIEIRVRGGGESV